MNPTRPDKMQRARARARVYGEIIRRAVSAAVAAVRGELDEIRRRGELAVQVAEVTAVETDADGLTWADVVCRPTGLRLTARVATPTRSFGERPRVGDEALVVLPRGQLLAGAALVAVLPTQGQAGPADVGTGAVHTSTDATVRVDCADYELAATASATLAGQTTAVQATGGQVQVSATGPVVVSGSAFQVSAPSLALGSGGAAVARSGDAIAVTLSAPVLAWLNAVGTATGAGSFPAASLSGTVTGGNPNVTA